MKPSFSIINYQLSIILLFFAAFAGCGDDNKDKEPVVAVTGVVLNHRTLIADFPGEAQLTATVEPADATNKEVTWHIEPVDVAAIGDNGELMTLRPGKATISVTTEHGLFSDTCVLTVMATSSVSSIEATVEEGASYNDKVNTVQAAIWKSYSTETGDVYASIAEGAYTEGGFTLTLPETIADEHLEPDMFKLEGVTLSDPAARTASIFNILGYRDDVLTGTFVHATDPDTDDAQAILVYADRDVLVIGNGTHQNGSPGWTFYEGYDLNLKKGWNTVYKSSYFYTTNRHYYNNYTNVQPEDLKWWYAESN